MTNVQRIVIAVGLLFATYCVGAAIARRGAGLAPVFGALLIAGLPTTAVYLLTGWRKRRQVEDGDLEGRQFPQKRK